MLLARVEGNVVATRKHPSLDGWRLVICQPINQSGAAEGAPQVAIDAHGAGMHQRVVISSDGSAARAGATAWKSDSSVAAIFIATAACAWGRELPAGSTDSKSDSRFPTRTTHFRGRAESG